MRLGGAIWPGAADPARLSAGKGVLKLSPHLLITPFRNQFPMQKTVRLPQVELNMERVQVVRWLVDIGDLVAVDQPILEVETQKATVEVPSMGAGFVRRKCVSETDEIGEGAVLCVLTDNAEDPFEEPGDAGQTRTAGAEARRANATAVGAKPARIVPAAPAARRLAKELGIDLTVVHGSGPEGRVTEGDVRACAHGRDGAATGDWKPIAAVRRALNDQMERSLREIPQFHLRRDMDVSTLMAAPSGTTFTHRLIHCTAKALKRHPALRTSIAHDKVKELPIDIAIAMQAPSGLVAPVLRNVDQRSLTEIAAEVRSLAQRAGELKREEVSDAPFAISNLGMFGIDSFDAFLFYGQTAVLAIGKTRGDGDGCTVASFSLALDHRVVDGVEGARFLAALQEEINDFEVPRTSK